MAAVLTCLLIASMIPGHFAYAQSADSLIDFAENDTGPVGTFTAYDQDGDVITWSLSGPDGDLFTIDGGVLSFREPPDYENPLSRSGGNEYRVTVEAGDGTHDVVVTVGDVDEAGTVSMDRRQPQVDRPFEAVLSDEDVPVTGQRWRWSRSEDGTRWADIRGAMSPRRTPEPADVGMYLRATVTYSDKFGKGKTVSAVSERRVEARTLSNASPSFAGQDDEKDTAYIDIVRSVRENTPVGTAIGRAVSATDADGDILFYELLDTPDLRDGEGEARFTIDSASGQIRVGKELGADAGEREDEDSTSLPGVPALEDEAAGNAANSEYVLRVRASDSSTASATVNVIVRVTDVNEAPSFSDDAPRVLRVRENDETPVLRLLNGTPVDADTYSVTDQDAVDTTLTYEYSVDGVDRDVLTFNGDDVLVFMANHEPDFEKKDSYSITIVARSGEGFRRLTATLDVSIEVVDADDAGEVVLSQREPRVGTEVYATVNDPDGGVSISEWKWERSVEVTVADDGTPSAECRADPGTPTIPVVDETGWLPIAEASSAVYIPTPDDVGRCLRATATYKDALADDDQRKTGVTEAPVQADSPVNTAPDPLVQSDRTSRAVAENTGEGRPIGAPVISHDADGDLLIYTLGGPDAALFDISKNSGQLKTKASLNYEARKSYAVIVTATDPSGAAVRIPVTINVTNRDDPAEIAGSSSIDFAENGTGPVGTFAVYDQDGDVIGWSVGGPDGDLFTIGGGVLSFREPPDYEVPRSWSGGNEYRVTIEADGDTHDVIVKVVDVDEAGTVRMARRQPQVGRPFVAVLSDEDGEVAVDRWRWSRSEDGRTWTEIEEAISPERIPEPADVGMYLRAAVTYSDKFGAGKTVSEVSANRVERRTLSNLAPSFARQDDDEDTVYIEVARSVRENTDVGTAIGRAVSATDGDGDILFYELLDTPDLKDDEGDARFTIDSASGQLKVGKVLGADAALGNMPTQREDEDSTADLGEPALPAGEDAGAADNSEYVLKVRVSDPSTASATVNVIVTVTDVNEAPRFDEDAPRVLRVTENEKPLVIRLLDGTPVDASTYAVTDQDGEVTGPDGYDDTNYTYSVTGADRDAFFFNSAGVLSFKVGREPDFEKKDSYSITIVARSGEDSRALTAKLNVSIEVVDGDDAGEVVLSQRQPQVGIGVLATLKDPDNGVTIARWVWERSDEITGDAVGTTCLAFAGDWTPTGVASAVYVPRAADVGRCLRAKVVYRDELAEHDLEAARVSEVPVGWREDAATPPTVNAAPAFPDQDYDTEGVQSDRTSRMVAENTKAGLPIGAPVSARDADGDLLIYTLGGPDAASFNISIRTGQLKTKSSLNYENKSVYTVVVTATDPFGAAAKIEVTINITDEDDPAQIRVVPNG